MSGPERKAASHLVISGLHYLFFWGGGFYLFPLAHISVITLHQPAATWGWADFMSVRGTARRQVRDRGCWWEACVITQRWGDVFRRAHSMLKVPAGIRWLSRLRKSSLLNGPGGLGPVVAFLFCLWLLDRFCASSAVVSSAPLNRLPSHRFIMNAGNDFLILFTLKGSVVFIAFATKKGACGLIYDGGNRAHFAPLCCILYIFPLIVTAVCCLNLPLPRHDDSRSNSWVYISAGGFDNWFFFYCSIKKISITTDGWILVQ